MAVKDEVSTRMNCGILMPYCVFPPDTGGKAEMLNHLRILTEMGRCRVLSADRWPVGTVWTESARKCLSDYGAELELREPAGVGDWRQALGLVYASFCKGLGFEQAFGHANPYHRWAFPEAWWRRATAGLDLVMICYSYWARLPTTCPKVILLLDLWSDYMKLWNRKETEELRSADAVIVISTNERERLLDCGVTNVYWCPPLVEPMTCPDSSGIGLVGSASDFNREGLAWLAAGAEGRAEDVQVFGGLARHAVRPGFVPVGRYEKRADPYERCGIVLMTTAQGMGVQIKGIEALAAGRAIVARRGAMRGIPPGNGAWVEVDTGAEMWRVASELSRNAGMRRAQSQLAMEYYRLHLDSRAHHRNVQDLLTSIAGRRQA